MADTQLVMDFLVGKDQVTDRMDMLSRRLETLGRQTARGFITTEKAQQEVSNLEKQFGKMDGAIQRTFREGEAAANIIVNNSLTDRLLKMRGIEATQQLAASPNSKVVVIGSGSDGLPIILGNN